MCDMIFCKDGGVGTVAVDENIGDGCWRVLICQACADTIGIKENQVIPPYDTVEKAFKENRK